MKLSTVFITSTAIFQLADAFGYLQNLGADESSRMTEIEARLEGLDAFVDATELRLEVLDTQELRLDALVNGVDIDSSGDCYKLGTVGDMTCPGMAEILHESPSCYCQTDTMYCYAAGSCYDSEHTYNKVTTLCFPEVTDKDSCETWFASVTEAQATWTEGCLVGQTDWRYQFGDMSHRPSGKCYGHVYVPSDPNPPTTSYSYSYEDMMPSDPIYAWLHEQAERRVSSTHSYDDDYKQWYQPE
jgi:hypothetical protein